MLSLRAERVMNLLTIMEHAVLSLQLCGFVSHLQTMVWFPVCFFFHSCQQKDLNFKGIVAEIEIILRKQRNLISFTCKTLDI